MNPTSEGKPDLVSNRKEWDDIVSDSISPTFFHTWAWKCFLEKQGYKARYIAVRDSLGDVVGGCPFFLSRHHDFLWRLESLPESQLGGPLPKRPTRVDLLSSGTLTFIKSVPLWRRVSDARVRLTDESLHSRLNVGQPEVNQGSGFFVLDLEKRPADTVWKEFHGHHHNQRNKIREMEKSGYEFSVATQRNEVLELRRLRNLILEAHGKPVKNSDFYTDLWDMLYPEYLQVGKVTFQGAVVCIQAFFTVSSTRTIHLAYSGNDKVLAGAKSCDLLLHWKTVQWASDKGYRFLTHPTSSDPTNRYRKYWMQFGPDFIQMYRLAYDVHPILFKLSRGIHYFRRTSVTPIDDSSEE